MTSLNHAERQYDANERRERYLRDRELKGRQPGKGIESSTKSGSTQSNVVRTSKQRQVSSEAKRKKIAAETEQLKQKLAKLKEVLKQLVAQAKQRSGAETKAEPTKKASESKSSSDEKLTSKQKADKAKASKEAYEKEKKDSPEDQLKAVKQQIKDIQEKIQKKRAELAGSKPSPDQISKSKTTKERSSAK